MNSAADNSSRGVAAPARRRGKGRPARGAQTVGRDALVECACRMLKSHPPAAVTRAAVARELGVDPSLIRYYFRDRATLLLAATERLVAEFPRIVLRQDDNASITAEGRLRARISALLQLEVTYPHFHRLLLDEIVPLKRPEAVQLLQRLTDRGMGEYRSILAQGLREGTLRDLELPFLFIAVIGLCNALVEAAPVLEVAQGSKGERKNVTEQYRRFICDLVVSGLKADPSPS